MPLSKRLAAGLGLSLLVHLPIVVWLSRQPPPRPPADAPAPAMQLRLVQAPPPRVEVPDAPVPPPRTASRTARSAPAPRPAAEAPAPARPATAAPPLIMLAADDDTATAASAPAPGAGHFDLQAARGAARDWAMGEGAGLGGADGKGSPMRATRDEKLGQAIERSRPADCRSAYAGMGVLAVIPLAASAVTGKGCKW